MCRVLPLTAIMHLIPSDYSKFKVNDPTSGVKDLQLIHDLFGSPSMVQHACEPSIITVTLRLYLDTGILMT